MRCLNTCQLAYLNARANLHVSSLVRRLPCCLNLVMRTQARTCLSFVGSESAGTDIKALPLSFYSCLFKQRQQRRYGTIRRRNLL